MLLLCASKQGAFYLTTRWKGMAASWRKAADTQRKQKGIGLEITLIQAFFAPLGRIAQAQGHDRYSDQRLVI